MPSKSKSIKYHGFAHIFLLIIIVLIGITGVGYFAFKNKQVVQPQFVNTNTDSRCFQKPESGRCFARFQRYFFDQDSNKCSEFVWGGCGGVVPFETIDECQSICETQEITDTPSFTRITWEETVVKIQNCEIKSVIQKHNLEVYLYGRDGTEYRTTEPKIDDVSKVTNSVASKCPPILSGSE